MDNLEHLLYRELKNIWGYDEFRYYQKDIVKQIIHGQDGLVIMPTGGGKSLCYQLPAHIMQGVAIVITPLVALMKDQVDGARENGLRAGYLSGTMEGWERHAILSQVKGGELDLLYLAPERLALNDFLEHLKQINVSLFAIDEAHCLSEWGHDFRPDYLALCKLKKLFPNVPIAAFTASATGKVQHDIIKKLNLRNPFRINASFNRENLFYQVEHKNKDVESQILQFIKEYKHEAGIVYRSTRKKVEETADFLQHNGIAALPYHAGLPPEERQKNQEAFNRDSVNVIVATIAFGMGIDKSNIRYVVHGDLPKNLESYYQETGRAGRDGEASRCILFYAAKDEATQHYFISLIEDTEEQQRATHKLRAMVAFVLSQKCRRISLLNYFGEKYPKDNCGACDICVGNVKTVDMTINAQIFMSAILRTGEQFGVSHIINVIRGSKNQQIYKYQHHEIKTYGVGKQLSKKEWRQVYEQLRGTGAIEQYPDEHNRLVLTERGRDILFGRRKFSILKRLETKTRIVENSDYDQRLFEELRRLRKKLADDNNVAPFMVASDKTLHAMCRSYPVNKRQILDIPGIGLRKYHQYGDDFIKCIIEFCALNPKK